MQMDHLSSDPLRVSRISLVEATLPHVPFDGWSSQALRMGARDAGLADSDVERLFPGGAMDAIDFLDRLSTDRMVEALELRDLAALRVRERAALAIRLRLEPLNPHREALRRAAAVLALPFNGPRAARMLWRTVDAIWYAIGDTSTDFNFYTKRALLAGVFASTTLVWLEDKSPACEASWAFLDRRIDDVMQIEKFKSRLFGGGGRPRMRAAG